MRARKAWSSPGATVSYLLDVGGGMYSASEMPVPVALEIARNSGELALVTVNGVEYLRIDRRTLVLSEAFDLQGRKVPREGDEAPERPQGRA